MAKRFTIEGSLEYIFDEVSRLNKENRNANVTYGPFLIRGNQKTGYVYQALITQLKD